MFACTRHNVDQKTCFPTIKMLKFSLLYQFGYGTVQLRYKICIWDASAIRFDCIQDVLRRVWLSLQSEVTKRRCSFELIPDMIKTCSRHISDVLECYLAPELYHAYNCLHSSFPQCNSRFFGLRYTVYSWEFSKRGFRGLFPLLKDSYLYVLNSTYCKLVLQWSLLMQSL